jgi:colanic acid/amylovoran biosynthesis glycosyltransferase
MRIAFVVDQFPALSQTFVLRQIAGLLERGHRVDIFSCSQGDESLRHPEIEKYGLLNRTYYLTACACSQSGPLRFMKRLLLLFASFHKNPAVVLKTLNVLKFGKGALLLQVLCQVAPFLGKGPYDIIHCQFGNLGTLGLLLKDTGLSHGKVITSFRGYDISSYPKSHGNTVYTDLLRRGDLFLCVSEHIKEKLIRFGCDERNIVVHRSGVDTKNDRLRLRSVGRNEPVKILTVARLTEKKGVEYGIRAIAQVLPKCQRIEYMIAGDGPLKDKLQALIGELELEKSVRLLGWKSQDDIAALLQNSDILLAPSVTTDNGDEEGIPGVIMEAFAHGLPVVSTQHAGIPEVVKDRESGLLAPERDVDAMAKNLLALIEDPVLQSRMGQEGRKFVTMHCNIESLNDRLVEIYQNLTN